MKKKYLTFNYFFFDFLTFSIFGSSQAILKKGAGILATSFMLISCLLSVQVAGNYFFGGNSAVTGLMVGQDIARVLDNQPEGHRYLLPDVCLSEGRFLDGLTTADLPRPVEVIPTDGIALRRALELTK